MASELRTNFLLDFDDFKDFMRHVQSLPNPPHRCYSCIYPPFKRLPPELREMLVKAGIVHKKILVVRAVDENAADCKSHGCTCDATTEADDDMNSWIDHDGWIMRLDPTPTLCFVTTDENLYFPKDCSKEYSAEVEQIVKAQLPDTLLTFSPFNQEIRYDAAQTAIYIENLWEVLQRCTYFSYEGFRSYGLFCWDQDNHGNGIRHLLIDANWFVSRCGDTFLTYPFVNLFNKAFPDIDHITVLIDAGTIQLKDHRILRADYELYDAKAPVNTAVANILDRLANRTLSDQVAQRMLISHAQAYCALTPDELFAKETEDSTDEIPLRTLMLPPIGHSRHITNGFLSQCKDFMDGVVDEVVRCHRWGAFEKRWDHQDEDPEPTRKPPPRITFHEGSTANGLKLFSLPTKHANDRFSFGATFDGDEGDEDESVVSDDVNSDSEAEQDSEDDEDVEEEEEEEEPLVLPTIYSDFTRDSGSDDGENIGSASNAEGDEANEDEVTRAIIDASNEGLSDGSFEAGLAWHRYLHG